MMQDRLIKGGEYESHLIKKVPASTMREMLYKCESKSEIKDFAKKFESTLEIDDTNDDVQMDSEHFPILEVANMDQQNEENVQKMENQRGHNNLSIIKETHSDGG